MRKFSQKWCLVSFLEPVEEGFEFHRGDCPLHITLADTFAVNWDTTDLLNKLTVLLAEQKPVEVVAGDDAFFGPSDEPVQVAVMKNIPELQALHDRVIKELKNAKAVFNNPQYVGKGYGPHSTVQKHTRLHKGDTVKIDNMTLIDMFPNGDAQQRKVVKSIKFSK